MVVMLCLLICLREHSTATNQSQEEDSVAAEDSAEEAQEINN
jgi:hypothetical protein